jgi:hypothetical protein
MSMDATQIRDIILEPTADKYSRKADVKRKEVNIRFTSLRLERENIEIKMTTKEDKPKPKKLHISDDELDNIRSAIT